MSCSTDFTNATNTMNTSSSIIMEQSSLSVSEGCQSWLLSSKKRKRFYNNYNSNEKWCFLKARIRQRIPVIFLVSLLLTNPNILHVWMHQDDTYCGCCCDFYVSAFTLPLNSNYNHFQNTKQHYYPEQYLQFSQSTNPTTFITRLFPIPPYPTTIRRDRRVIISSSSSSSLLLSSSTALHMVLIPLDVDEMNQLISVNGKPTSQQYEAYLGRTSIERYNLILEGSIVALIGCSMSYFLSFVVGGFVATCLGTATLLWGILSPELKAYQRNWELIGGRPLLDPIELYDDYDIYYDNNKQQQRRGLYGALWIGKIADVCVVEDSNDSEEYDLVEFQDYDMENDELEKYTGQPYLLRLLIQDTIVARKRQRRKYRPYSDNDDYDDVDDDDDDEIELSPPRRELQIHARMSEEYNNLKKDMSCLTLLLSTDPNFTELAALTDVYVYNPKQQHQQQAGAVLVGDYPYLDRAGIENFFRLNPDVWDMFINQQRTKTITS